ncbi:MAG: phosphotransferase enzyme family protein [Gammaproteobacteria bacterium]
MNDPLCVASQFADSVIDLAPLGNGLINDTFLVEAGTFRFVLQRINREVFPEPERIMANLTVLDRCIHRVGEEAIGLRLPHVLKTKTGFSHFLDPYGDVWRAQSYITGTESLETVREPGDAYQAGWALGRFHRLLSGLDPALMCDTLPGFHITPGYLSRYRQLVARPDTPPSSLESRYCDHFISEHAFLADDLESAKQRGLLPIRVIHGDPKLNNFLFDKHSGKVVSLVDLDTVKPGLLHYDIGDCVRSCCHDALAGVIDLDTAAAILEGYLGEGSGFLTDQDYRYLYSAIRLIPFELGLRFYSDYLEGDRYFKVTEPEQNLWRAVEQFRLCTSVISREQDIQRLLDGIRRKV